MRIVDLNWMRVEEYLERDDRAVVPLGSTEQHAYLSLGVDKILAERVAIDAAEPLGIPVFPPVAYGLTPYFSAFPGTVTLTPATYTGLVTDILDSLQRTGFRRVVFVNGHGGNALASEVAADWVASNPGLQVRFHNWWKAPQTLAFARSMEPVATHASWLENFPWTRLAGVALPEEPKPELDTGGARIQEMSPEEARAVLGDGSFGGSYQRSDDEMLALWAVAVKETRRVMTEDW